MEENEILDAFKAFMETGAKGCRLDGVQAHLQALANRNQLPIMVVQHYKNFYLYRTDQNGQED